MWSTWVDSVVGLENVKNDIALMRTPDGHSQIELMKFNQPKAINTDPKSPVNTMGIRRLCFLLGPEGIIVALAEQLGEKSVNDILENQ